MLSYIPTNELMSKTEGKFILNSLPYVNKQDM